MPLSTAPSLYSSSAAQEFVSDIQGTQFSAEKTHRIAMPTLKLLLAHAREIDVSPDEAIRVDMFTDSQDAFYATQSGELPTETKDTAAQIYYNPAIMGSSNSINMFERRKYDNPRSRYNLATQRVNDAHRGFTEALNYTFWSPRGATATEVVNGEINLDTFMASHSPGVKIKGVEANTQFFNSIPLAIRNDATATGADGGTSHTFGNMAASNARWRAHVKTYGNVTYDTTATNAYVGLPTTIANPVPMTEAILTDLLDEMQIGEDYPLYVACPPKIYSALTRPLFAQGRANTPQEMTNLGLKRAITHDSYNAIIYSEPALANSNMWPYSVWVWSPNKMFLALDREFSPLVFDWQQVGFSTVIAFAMLMWGQLVVTDRRALGVIHGVRGN